MSRSTQRNKEVVREFVQSVPSRDVDTMRAYLTENCVRHLQLPSARAGSGSLGAPDAHGREALLDGFRRHLYALYREGSISVEILHMVAEDDLVSAHFVFRATTARKGEPYENWYHFLYRLEGGRIAEYWEYVDTAYATEKLFTP